MSNFKCMPKNVFFKLYFFVGLKIDIDVSVYSSHIIAFQIIHLCIKQTMELVEIILYGFSDPFLKYSPKYLHT